MGAGGDEISRMSSAERVEALRAMLSQDTRPVLVIGHNYPDPDCLGASLAFQHWVREFCGLGCDIALNGGLGRAENRAMVGILGIEMQPVEEIDAARYQGAFVVDTQPGAGNVTFPDGIKILAVFDHHAPPENITSDCAWTDVRLGMGCTATIATEYLDASEVIIDRRLATALYLGVRTDTEELERDATPADLKVYTRLLPHIDRPAMLQVIRPPLSESYFGLLRQALQSARRWNDAVVTNCGPLSAPDLLSEVSELLIRLKGTNLSLAVGTFAGRVHLSLRSSRNTKKETLRLLREVIGQEGSIGGHGCAAGGVLTPENGDVEGAAEALCALFVEGVGAAESGSRPVCHDVVDRDADH